MRLPRTDFDFAFQTKSMCMSDSFGDILQLLFIFNFTIFKFGEEGGWKARESEIFQALIFQP